MEVPCSAEFAPWHQVLYGLKQGNAIDDAQKVIGSALDADVTW